MGWDKDKDKGFPQSSRGEGGTLYVLMRSGLSVLLLQQSLRQ